MSQPPTAIPSRAKILVAAENIAKGFMLECPPANINEQQMQRYGMLFIQRLRTWAELAEIDATQGPQEQ